MLGVMSLNVLQAYEEFIEKVTKRYVGAWHLIASADDRARSEQLGRLRLLPRQRLHEGGSGPGHCDHGSEVVKVIRCFPGNGEHHVVVPRVATLVVGAGALYPCGLLLPDVGLPWWRSDCSWTSGPEEATVSSACGR